MGIINRFFPDTLIDMWGFVGKSIGKRDIFDHFPIWLKINKFDQGPKPFRVNDSWFENKEFINFMEKEWSEIKVVGRSGYVIKEKLKMLKERLKSWNKQVFWWINLKVDEWVEEIKEVNKLLTSCVEDQVEELVVRRSNTVNSMWINLAIKDNMFLQQSKMKQTRDRDLNNKFFHNFMKGRNRMKFIGSLNTDMGVIDSAGEFKEEILEFFKMRFTKPGFDRPLLEGLTFRTLSQSDVKSLEDPFSDQDIKEVVWGCEGFKSHGPDGYNFVFIKNCWHVLKKDMTRFVKDFHCKEIYLKPSLPLSLPLYMRNLTLKALKLTKQFSQWVSSIKSQPNFLLLG